MSGPAEGQVAIIAPSNVQTIRVCEAPWIAVSSRHYCDNGLALANFLVMEDGVNRGQSGGVLARAIIAKQLFDSGWDE